MSLSVEQKSMIRDAISKRVRDPLICPFSGDDNWLLESEFAILSAADNPSNHPAHAPYSFPMVVMMCRTCGYSTFFNLIQLGLAEHFDLQVVE